MVPRGPRNLNTLFANEKMDKDRIARWLEGLNSNGYLYPPGCEASFTKLPGRDGGYCTVGIVHEHRFAFYFWALDSIEKNLSRAALITVDAHDDVGVPDEVIPDDLDNLGIHNELDNLNVHNRIELGLFAWLRLRSLNDGHILPALYLNFFSDVFVLLNDHEDSAGYKSNREKQPITDRDGREHKVRFYRNPEKLLYDLPKDCPVFLDIDLDYFSLDNPEAGSVHGSEKLMDDADIRKFLSVNGPLFGQFFNRIVGMTIALEPKYCGGLLNSLHVLIF